MTCEAFAKREEEIVAETDVGSGQIDTTTRSGRGSFYSCGDTFSTAGEVWRSYGSRPLQRPHLRPASSSSGGADWNQL